MTECLNDDDDDEANQRRFASCFVPVRCISYAIAGINLMENVFSLPFSHFILPGCGSGTELHGRERLLCHLSGELISR